MNLDEFKKTIYGEFGKNLEHATPGNVRDFLDHKIGTLGPQLKGRIVLEERAASFEEVLKDFFVRVLELPREDAIVMLWLLAFDFAFSSIELQQAERFKSLFGDYE